MDIAKLNLCVPQLERSYSLAGWTLFSLVNKTASVSHHSKRHTRLGDKPWQQDWRDSFDYPI